jgi:hypothetical protein
MGDEVKRRVEDRRVIAMECHKCPHREEIDAGKYRAVGFANTPCATCELVETSGYTLAFDEGRPGQAVEGEQWPANAGDVEAEEDMVPMSVMSEAVTALLAMRAPVRDVVCWRFSGMKYVDIAYVLGITVGAVENRLRRAMRRWPALRALFAEKAAKQKRRKPHGKRRPLRIQGFRSVLAGEQGRCG